MNCGTATPDQAIKGIGTQYAWTIHSGLLVETDDPFKIEGQKGKILLLRLHGRHDDCTMEECLRFLQSLEVKIIKRLRFL